MSTMHEWIDDPYERFIGRWSRLVAPEFLDWLDMPSKLRWLDVGCGTGALSSAILERSDPLTVDGCDPSETMLPFARAHAADPRVSFRVGEAGRLPYDSGQFDVVVSGLVLNFIPDVSQGLVEMARVVTPGGVMAAYVWDYADGMQLLRFFWDAAMAVDSSAAALDEGRRFPLCRPEALESRFRGAGLGSVKVDAIDVPTNFRGLDDLWQPFLGGAGPAGSYTASLSPADHGALRRRLESSLPIAADGSISLIARAWAVRGQAE
jgi:SAM-dependent methyltransferase